MEVCIVNYGFGNIWSLQSAITYLGFKCKVSSNPKDILSAKKLLLPGAGAFKSAMESLEEKNLVAAIRNSVAKEGNQILGICLGMQIMADAGHEHGLSKGLGLIKGQIEPMDPNMNLKIPHIGFNEVEKHAQSKLFRDVPNLSDFYFVHSFHLLKPPLYGISSLTTYGKTFVAAYEFGNVFATQFHPEKSQSNGLKVLQNFLDIPNA